MTGRATRPATPDLYPITPALTTTERSKPALPPTHPHRFLHADWRSPGTEYQGSPLLASEKNRWSLPRMPCRQSPPPRRTVNLAQKKTSLHTRAYVQRPGIPCRLLILPLIRPEIHATFCFRTPAAFCQYHPPICTVSSPSHEPVEFQRTIRQKPQCQLPGTLPVSHP